VSNQPIIEMNKKKIHALKMKLASLNIKIIDAKNRNQSTHDLQAAFDVLAKYISTQN
jgi:hypothetical protein